MEFAAAIRSRHMVRAFAAEPVAPDVLDGVLDAANRAPSAGWSQGTDFVVLQGDERFTRYWDLTLPTSRRGEFAWPGLFDAPVLIIAVIEPEAYARRYAEADKVITGLGVGTDAWSVPYWWVDGGMAVENLLLSAVDAGLGACLFGLFDYERAVLDALGVPGDRRALSTIALGHADPTASSGAGRSVRTRERRALSDVVHHGRW